MLAKRHQRAEQPIDAAIQSFCNRHFCELANPPQSAVRSGSGNAQLHGLSANYQALAALAVKP